MKRYISVLSIICFASVMGCATSKDLNAVRHSLDAKIFTLEEDLSSLKKENSKLQKELDQVVKINQSLRESQANNGADFIDLRTNVQELRGDVETLHMTLSNMESDIKGKDSASIRDKFDDISFRINYIENFLGVGKKSEQAEETEKTEKTEEQKKPSLKTAVDKEKTYAEAYKTFKEGNYKEAREKFHQFIKIFPDTEYSDNAQFWIGESYYFEKNYEKAILEYETVIKNYPKGNKVPNALLKQALSFLQLDDKSSAKLLLQRVIKEYPNTSPARIARGKLSAIK